jgi:signal transduction histidine kinase
VSDTGMDEGLLREVARGHADLVGLLERGAALRAGLDLLGDGRDIAWIAEPTETDGLVLSQVRGDRTGLLRGLDVPQGLGLTGKVHRAARPGWVNDYFGAADITHTFDQHIDAEGVRRLLAVPVVWQGQVFGVLAVGARDSGEFDGRAVEQASAVADEVALAVAVAERVRLAREVAVHEERSRLAADLHDTVGALLFAIGSGVAGLADAAAGDAGLSSKVEQLRRQASDASGALRDSLRTLRSSPAALKLAVALREDTAGFADRTGSSAELVLLDDLPALPPSRVEVLVAAVREALLNVEKHAQAQAVVVSISRRLPDGRDGIVIAVTDDGIGLAADHRAGIGLSSTADAVGRLGGVLCVASETQGSGTLWRVELPC